MLPKYSDKGIDLGLDTRLMVGIQQCTTVCCGLSFGMLGEGKVCLPPGRMYVADSAIRRYSTAQHSTMEDR